MSLGDWTSGALSVMRRSLNRDPSGDEPSISGSSVKTLTLTDWLHKKKDDFRPENRVQSFITQAEQSLESDNYEDAIALYSNAIDLLPTDNLFVSRSYCHEKTNKFDLSLIDAQKAIELSDESVAKRQKTSKPSQRISDLTKYRNKLMFYRKARALRHLKRFQEAIDTLVLSKTLAIECQFIDNEIKDIKLQVICDLGYDRPSVEEVCNQLDSIEELIKLLKQRKQLMITNSSVDHLPSNPFKYRGLYVNGLTADLEEKRLEELLSICGELLRCKVYSNGEQSRAIIAFSEEQSVPEAIRNIRSHEEIIRDQSLDNLVIRYRHTCVEGGFDLRADPQNHFKGTEIGGECFKWRTTGCDDEECKGLHIPICHHLDQQSIETKSVERKRQPIVFDSSVTKVKSTVRQQIKFDINGTDSSNTTLTLISPSKRLRVNNQSDNLLDIESPSLTRGSHLLCSEKTLSSDRKVVRLKSNSDSQTNDLSSTPKVRTERKRIVFDLKNDDEVKDSINNKSIHSLNSSAIPPSVPPPKTPLSDRNVTSYDDLFD